MFGRLLLTLTIAMMFPGFAACSESGSGDSPQQNAILITGASTGLGRAMAEHLAGNGYFVYAGARKQTDLDALNAIENIQAVRLDVTRQDEIDAAVAIVRAGGKGLHALVNNAGVLITGPSAEADIDEVHWLFDVNVYGVMRMSSAFAPMLIESKGRIINIGSIAGSVGFPYLGAYTMSKHALEAYTEALHTEMSHLGVSVSIIKPGDYASSIWKPDTQLERVAAMKAAGSPYVEGYDAWLQSALTVESGEPVDVAHVVAQALSDEPMARRYLIVPNENEMGWVMGNLIDRLADLNRNNDFAWSLDKIAQELQASMADKESAKN